MRKITLVIWCFLTFTIPAFAQGKINFVNNVTGTLQSKIFGIQVGNPTQSLTGNTSAGIPAGSTIYSGSALSGTNYLVQLFSASGASQLEGSLVAQGSNGTNGISTFRTGSAAGIWNGQTVSLSNVALDAAAATIQVRVWDNTSGLYSTWASAESAWLAGTIAAGKSSLLNINSIGGNITTPPNLTGLTSFNIYTIAAVPEPTTLVLAGLGGLSLLALRRKK